MTENAFDALLRQVARAPATLEWTLRPGVVVGERWKVLEEIGRGGMGRVVRAHDLVLGRDVALKFLDDAPSKAATDALLAEARAAAAVQHPSIVSLFDVGHTDDGRAFIAMEHIEGPSLRARLESGRLSAAVITDISKSIVAGLEAAWNAGLVHGDLKPENILVPDGAPAKILDFGLSTSSRTVDADPHAGAGTLPYMAPELLAGGERTKASDAFAFGAILYEMVTGAAAVRVDAHGAEPTIATALPSETAKALRPWGHVALGLLASEPDARLKGGASLSALLPQETRNDSVARKWTVAAVFVLVTLGVAAIALSDRPLSMAAFRGEQAAAPSLQSLPVLEGRPLLQAKFRAAAEHWYAGDDEAAVRALDEVLAANESAVGAWLLRLFAGHHDLDERSRASVIAALKTHGPSAAAPWSQVAALVVDLAADEPEPGRIEAAKAFADGLAEDNAGYFPSLLLARALAPHAPQWAEATLTRLLEQDPGPVRPALHLAWGHMRQGNERLAHAVVEQALERHPNHLALLLVRGQSELGRGRIKEANATFSKILKRHPGHLTARFAFAETLFLLDQPAAWRSELEAIASGPYPAALRGKGIALHARLLWSRGDFEGADEIFAVGARILDDKALLSPRLPLAFDRFRWAVVSENAAEMKRVEDALQRLRERVDLDAPTASHLERFSLALQSMRASAALPTVERPPASALDTRSLDALVTVLGANEANLPPRATLEAALDDAFAADAPAPLRRHSIFHQVLRARLLGDGPLVHARAFMDAANACAKRTHFEHLWCRVVLANEARRRAKVTDDASERERLQQLSHSLAPTLAAPL